MGLTILYANGCYPQYERLDSVSSENVFYDLPDWLIDNLLYSLNFPNTHISTFQRTNMPIFDGETILQYGSFIDESEDKNIMSKSIQSLIQTSSMENDNESYLNKLKKDLPYYKDLEKRSIRVVFTDNASEKGKYGDSDLPFHRETRPIVSYPVGFLFDRYQCMISAAASGKNVPSCNKEAVCALL